jgi:tRNA (adenine22-N1)-methyltransferase
MTKAMLDSGKCERAIVSDISEKCLEKARVLLDDYIADGKVESVVSNGFEKVGKNDLALIAGMGGEEIISILTKAKALPEKLVLQPMKNPDKVRLTVVKLGYRIVKDLVFFAGDKYYDLMVLVKGKDSLTDEEIEFGRTNILSPSDDFKRLTRERKEKLAEYLKNENLSERSRLDMTAEMERLEKYV